MTDIHEKYKKNFFKSSDMEELYRHYPNPWGATRDVVPVVSAQRYDDMVSTVLRYLSDTNFKYFAELGCGEGYFADYCHKRMSEVEIHGYDISQTAVERATQVFGNPMVKFFQRDLAANPDHVQLYDGIFYADFIYYIESHQGKVAAATFAVNNLRPGGFVFVLDRSRMMKNTTGLFTESLGFKCCENRFVKEAEHLFYRMTVFTR